MTELKDYIRRSLEAAPETEADSRQIRINFFKERVEGLYRLVNDDLLADLREDGLYVASYADEVIVEDGLGKYNTRSMLVKLGRLRVELRPYGTDIIGARGRVDMWVNDNDESAMLLLVPSAVASPKEPISANAQDWVWKMVERKISKVSYQQLTPDVFQKKILTLASLSI